MGAQIPFFGHSFVRRFGSFLQSDSSFTNLLPDGDFHVTCIGFGGLTLQHRRRLESVKDQLAGADLVLLDIGSND